ncbi:MAG: hypothetical protein P9L99_18305 [Candidatus Lernaella stagnicola]|nr:hypothetical protein [Candidatus Lernaella stagnicola]
MKKIATATIIAFTFALAITLIPSCMGEPADEHSIEWLLREGKTLLENHDGSKAYNLFHQVVERDPDNLEGLYGLILSLDHRVFANIDGVIDLLAGVYIFEPSREDCRDACDRLAECNLFEEAWTTPETCMQDCPFSLQPFMFDTMLDGSTCNKIRGDGLEWIVPTKPANCKALCENLDFCGKIVPPVTFTVEECITHCPHAYVERHSKCYLESLGSCNGQDRTCFEHTTVGVQILFREIGIFVPPQIDEYSKFLLERPNDYQYDLEDYYWSLVDPPLEINLEGRYDHGFLYLSRALGNFFHVLLLTATSVQLEMNFPNFDLNFNYGNPQGAEEFVDAAIVSMEILLYDPIYPNGFTVYDEPWAYENVKQGGLAIGRGFGSIADMFDFMFVDHDRQLGKALHYDDDNNNFNWDDNETWTLPGFDDIVLTKAQCAAIRDFARAMEANLLEREPVQIELLTGILESFNLGSFDFIVDLLIAWTEDGTFDVSPLFWEPGRYDFRILLQQLIDELKIVAKIIDEFDL